MNTMIALRAPTLRTAADFLRPAALFALLTAPLVLLANALLTWQNRIVLRDGMVGMPDHLRVDAGLSKEMISAEIDKPFWAA